MIKNIIYLSLLIIIMVVMFFNSSEIINSVNFSFSLCINNLFPSLFPFMILSNILIDYGFVDISSELLKPIITRLFKCHECASFVLILSLISGSPSNAKYIKELLNKNLLNTYDASKIILFTHFINPLFIINTIGISFLKSKKIGLIILISHYFGNLIVGILFRNYHKSMKSNYINFEKTINSLKVKRNGFITILTSSIISTINTLLLILGIITTCLIITSLIDINPFFSGILEITQGLKYICYTDLEILKKAMIITFLISFGGISIHAQNFSILNSKKIKYTPYLIARIIHGIISSISVYILFKTVYI